MGEDEKEIKAQFNELIKQMNDNNTPDRGDLKYWKSEIGDLKTVMQEMWQESVDATQSPEYRGERKTEFLAMSKVCEPLLQQANDLLEEKQNQHTRNSMAGPSTAQSAAGATAAQRAAELKQTEAQKRAAMPPPFPRAPRR